MAGLNVKAIDELISKVLANQDSDSSLAFTDDLEKIFIPRALYHGVAALLHARLEHQSEWPLAIRNAVRTQALGQAMWELRHQQALTQLIPALGKCGIEPILIKGTALAYDLYANSAWRARGDTDMIITPRDLDRSRVVFRAIGFRRDLDVGRKIAMHQEGWSIGNREEGKHSIDLHWRVANSEILSRVFSYEELYAAARPLPRLCAGALSAGSVHALLLACLHRAKNKQVPYQVDGVPYYSGDRLIWLYDIHLLSNSLKPRQWKDFSDLAHAKGLSAVCLDGLERATAHFGTAFPDSVRTALLRNEGQKLVAAYLSADLVRRNWMDFLAIRGFVNKIQFLKERIFPPAAYMRATYPEARNSGLSGLYARHVFAHMIKRLKRTRLS